MALTTLSQEFIGPPFESGYINIMSLLFFQNSFNLAGRYENKKLFQYFLIEILFQKFKEKENRDAGQNTESEKPLGGLF
jgi:hypothetical protein